MKRTNPFDNESPNNKKNTKNISPPFNKHKLPFPQYEQSYNNSQLSH